MWGPGAPGGVAKLRELAIRRYRCTKCRTVMTVVPSEVLTKRLYTAAAIGWALALYGLSMLSPSAVRALVSPWRRWGATDACRWQSLRRWAVAALEGRLFGCVRAMPKDWSPRKAAARTAVLLGSHALPSPEPPSLDVLAFHGAMLAR